MEILIGGVLTAALTLIGWLLCIVLFVTIEAAGHRRD